MKCILHSIAKGFLLAVFLLPVSEAYVNAQQSSKPLPVSFKELPNEDKVEVYVGDNLFTAYHYDPDIKKPILFPINAADGTTLTRGYPLDPQPGEAVDHPHHTGHWLNHGVVNQVDFWTSTSEPSHHAGALHGSIVQQKITQLEEGKQGKIAYLAHWISDKGDTLLTEHTTFTFSGTKDDRIIDRSTRLTAEQPEVVFEDSKEGMMAVRVARFLEQPSETPQYLVAENGGTTKEKVLDNTGITGEYKSSEGATGDAVWGTRAAWVTLNAEKGGKNYSVTIMDHPDNVNHPPHWMARGYGLFAVNPLGSAAYTEGKETLNFTLEEGESTTFSYRILLHEGKELTESQINEVYDSFKK